MSRAALEYELEVVKRSSFRNRFTLMTGSLLMKQNIIVYASEYSDKADNESCKEKGEFVFFDWELATKPDSNRRNMLTKSLSLYIDGESYIVLKFFTDVFPRLYTLSLTATTAAPRTLKHLERLEYLKNLSLEVGNCDFTYLNLPHLERLHFGIFITCNSSNSFGLDDLKHFFVRHQNVAHLHIKVKGCLTASNETYKEYHHELIECCLENLTNLTEIVIETTMESFENLSKVESYVEVYAKVGFAIKFIVSSWEFCIYKSSMTKVTTKKPRMLGDFILCSPTKAA